MKAILFILVISSYGGQLIDHPPMPVPACEALAKELLKRNITAYCIEESK